ncbi:hypothetical protein [Saccharopolyspora sp. 5N708]|uniref:hypothetical protein n=1 Tax=Saccharopolyspora sp. 5N708 TaxID=3457424 RepID=UPI003FD4FF95
MSHLGEFSIHRRDGDHVTKHLNRRHPAGDRFVTAMTTTGAAGMQSYLDVLRSAQVRLPSDLRLVAAEPLTVRHRWVAGPNLLDATTDTDPATFAAAIAQIAHWVRDLDGTNARIDTNLANFCLEDNQPVLIDVLPPLIPSLRSTPANLFDELFGALCFDTPVILDALVGYALRTLLRVTDPAAAQELLDLAYEFPTNTADETFPAAWFRARRALAVRAAMGKAAVEEVQDLFALTSVLGFRQLDEAGRRLRIDQVARRIREW